MVDENSSASPGAPAPSPVVPAMPLADITNIDKDRMTNGVKHNENGLKLAPNHDDQQDSAVNDESAGPESWNEAERAKADAILTQVEYYFSDENLIKDTYLYGKMKGSKGKPVPVGLLHDFPKMRDFQPYSFVVEAIKMSKKLYVVRHNGKDCILRYKTFSRHDYENPGVPKQKVEKPTGFEPYYADPPITPAEADEEEDTYGDHNPFAGRIQVAMQRYKAKRKFSPIKLDIWTKFIKFGGIETGPRQFTGRLSKEDMEDKTAAEISQLTATDFARDDQYDLESSDSKWVVDFEGVARGFLSSIVTDYYNFSTKEEIEECTTVMLNFYNYIILHNVCPEYHDSINAARKVCGIANKELPGVCNIRALFPGPFNTACSALFGGRWATLLEDSPWMDNATKEETSQGLTRQKAKQTISLAAAVNAPDEWWTKNNAQLRQDLLTDQKILSTEDDVGFEVTEVISADEEARDMYEPHSHTFKVVGKLICKPWTMPDFAQFDLPKGYAGDNRPDSYEFWLEQDLLDLCCIGTKFKATVHKLSSGLYIMDGTTHAYPSYYKLLLNELLYEPGSNKKWKEPKEVTREEHLEREARFLPKPAEDAEVNAGQEETKQIEAPGSEDTANDVTDDVQAGPSS